MREIFCVMYVDLYQVQSVKPGGENQTTQKIYKRNILPVKISRSTVIIISKHLTRLSQTVDQHNLLMT